MKSLNPHYYTDLSVSTYISFHVIFFFLLLSICFVLMTAKDNSSVSLKPKKKIVNYCQRYHEAPIPSPVNQVRTKPLWIPDNVIFVLEEIP